MYSAKRTLPPTNSDSGEHRQTVPLQNLAGKEQVTPYHRPRLCRHPPSHPVPQALVSVGGVSICTVNDMFDKQQVWG